MTAYGPSLNNSSVIRENKILLSIYFSLIALALFISSLSGAALSWDGSAFFFAILDTQAPFTPYNRLIHVVLQWPVIIISHLTSDVHILGFIFGLTYSAIPIGVLVVCWWLVKDRERSLFIWPALCIGLATLPGQFGFIYEGTFIVQFAWPIVLAILVGIRRSQVPIIVLFAIALPFSHPPFAMVILVSILCLTLFISLLKKKIDRAVWLWLLAIIALIVITALRLPIELNSIHGQQMALSMWLWRFKNILLGLPLVGLFCTFLAAFILLGTPFIKKTNPQKRNLFSFCLFIEFISILIAAVSLTIWVSAAGYWTWASNFRFFSLFIALLFFIMACIYYFLRNWGFLEDSSIVWNHTVRTLPFIGMAFCLVLSVQSITWQHLTNRLSDTLTNTPWSCISKSSISWIWNTPLNSWTTPLYSLIVQGRAPEKVILDENGCEQVSAKDGIRLNEYNLRSWSKGWFNLDKLKQNLLNDLGPSKGCWFTFSSGWYNAEEDGQNWLRWSAGQGELLAVAKEESKVSIQGIIKSMQRPNKVGILVNGQIQETISLDWNSPGDFGLLILSLRAGENLIRLNSQNPAVITGSDGRALAIAISNLRLTIIANNEDCEFHP